MVEDEDAEEDNTAGEGEREQSGEEVCKEAGEARCDGQSLVESESML